MNVPGLRSCYDKTGGLYYFGRMIDKIRLHLKKELPSDYHSSFGNGFDDRCVKFLGVSHPEIIQRVSEGGNDDEILQWCWQQGTTRLEEDILAWNSFMSKRGWRDSASEILQERVRNSGLKSETPIETFFDHIEVDEGRSIPEIT